MKNIPVVIISVVLSGFLFAGCATVPERTAENDIGLLAPDSDLFFGIDVAPNRDMIERFSLLMGQDTQDLDEVLTRIEHILVGIEQIEENPQITLVADGQLPRSLVNLGVSTTGEWDRKCRAPSDDVRRVTWWKNEQNEIKMWAADQSILCLTTADLTGPVRRYYAAAPSPVPQEASVELLSADMSVYMPRLPAVLMKDLPIDPAKIHMNGLLLSAARQADTYTISGHALFQDKQEAATFTKVIRLMLVQFMKERGPEQLRSFMRESTVENRDKRIIFDGISLTENQLLDILINLTSQTGTSDGFLLAAGNSR